VSGEVFVLHTKVCDNVLLVVFRRCWPSIHAVVITEYYALTGVDTYRDTGNQRFDFAPASACYALVCTVYGYTVLLHVTDLESVT